MRKQRVLAFTFLTILVVQKLSSSALAHGNHHHEPPVESKLQSDALKTSLVKINATYIAQVRSIFLAKCFDCHSNQNRFPWYHKVPGIKQWLDDDVAEGKEHINMSHDFPFQGHGSPQDDLEAIQESLTKKTMPPFFYRLMHRGSALTQDEQETVFQWAEQGLKMLKDIHP